MLRFVLHRWANDTPSQSKMAASVSIFLRSRLGVVVDPLYDILRLHAGVHDEAIATAIIVALAVALLTTVFLLFVIVWNRQRHLRRAVLVVGLCDAGKTLIFSQLVHRRKVSSHTSVKENAGIYRSKNRKVTLFLVDLPGHERLRTRYLDQHKATSRGIIFVVDSTTVQANLKDAAEFLYNLLSDKDITHCRSVLIACNKQDASLAKSSSVIKNQLEKEMNTLRMTREATLDSTDGGVGVVNNNTYLGKRGKDFEFSHVQPFKIHFAECSAAVATGSDGDSGQCQLGALEDWLAKIA